MTLKKLLALASLIAACGGHESAVEHPRAKPSRVELDHFLGDEDRVLKVLAAADARIAERGIEADPTALHHATMGAILAEDTSLGMEGNRPDVLSFDVRARALDAAAATLNRWKTAPADIDGTRPDLELELLARLVATEKLRLASERDLPRSAGTLFGALAVTWRTPDLKEVGERDDWLSRRIAEVTKSLTPQSLTVDERDELDDALDPLERVIEGLPKSRAALVELRLAVQRVDLAAKPRDRWDQVGARLAADAGMHLSSETLLAFLTNEAKALRAEIDQLVGVKVTEDVAARAGSLLLAPPSRCHATVGSRVRALSPIEERAFECDLRAHVIDAHTAAENLDVLVAMHDAVVAASWAVIFARGGDATTIALGAPKLVAPLSPTTSGKLTRFAATHPIETITRALSIEWIMRNGLADAALRADAWRNFGDAPLDVIERELHPVRREKQRFIESQTHSSR